MRLAGKIAAKVLRSAKEYVVPGISTAELDEIIGRLIGESGSKSAFKGYQGFPGNSCISVNEEVIHGIAGPKILKFGDLVKLDIGVEHEGFIGDVAMTIAVGGCSPEAQRLMDVTSSALRAGLAKVCGGQSISVVSKTIQQVVELAGYGVIREFVGHGVGRSLHEDPQVPNYFHRGLVGRFEVGMTVAIEPMVSAGNGKVQVASDGWTVLTRDRTLSAHFEHTVLVCENGCEILTVDGLELY